jgi:hypothetical protein
MQDVQDDTGGAPFGQIPIMLLAEYAMQPRKRAARITSKGPLRLGPFMAGQNSGGDARRLIMEKEQGEQESMDYVAMQSERLLCFVGA